MFQPGLIQVASFQRNVWVGTYYYVWYEAGLASNHWNTSYAMVRDLPALGFYPSNNEATFHVHLSAMQEAGINLLIVSWWNESAIDEATSNLFRYVSESEFRYSFKLALMVDVGNETLVDYGRAYDYVWKNYCVKYADLFFNWQDRPLLLFFNPVRPTVDTRFTVRTVGNQPYANWNFWKAMSFLKDHAARGDFNFTEYEGNPMISSDGVVNIIPRYDDSLLYAVGQRNYYMRADPELTDGLYQAQWEFVLRNRGSVQLVIIYSWNEHHERTAIEPLMTANHLRDMTRIYTSKLNPHPTGSITLESIFVTSAN